MRAFILIAGEGTRLRPLTTEMPKPLVPIVNKPVLQYIIEHLASSGVTEIMMNPGYKGEMIEQCFGDGQQFGVSITYLPEMIESQEGYRAIPKGSGTSLALAQQFYQFFDQPVLVLCGDAIIDLDIQKAMDTHSKSSALVSVLLKEIDASLAHKYGVAKIDKTGCIKEFVEKPKIVDEVRCLANTGVYIFSPKSVSKIPLENGLDIGGDLLPKWVQQNERVMGINQPYQWLDIGTIEDYKKINHLTLKNQLCGQQPLAELPSFMSHRSRAKIAHNYPPTNSRLKRRKNSQIGNGCIIGSGTKLGESVIIGNNCVIGECCTIENSIIGPYCQIPASTNLTNSILTKDYLITFNRDGKWKKSIRLNSASSRKYFQSTDESHELLSIA